MSFRSLLRWAPQFLFSDGPKIGEPSKIHPDSLLATQGIRPGAGEKPGAEEMNAVIDLVTSEIRMRRFLPFTRWQVISDKGTRVAAARAYYTGTDYFIGRKVADTPSDLETMNALNGGISEEISAPSALWSDVDTLIHGCTRRSAVGLGLVVFFGVQASGARARYQSGASTFASADLNSSPTGAWPCFGAAHDRVNGAAVALLHSTNETSFVRLPDGTAPALVRATTQPALGAPTQQQVNVICAGDGRAIALYVGPGGFEAFTSIDGGVIWTALSVPRAAGTHMYGCAYVDDFLGNGPRFVFCGVSGDGEELYHTADGSAWETLELPAGVGGRPCVILGDVVITTPDTSVGVLGYDIRSGKVVACAAGFQGSNGRNIVSTGSRLYVGLVDGNTIRSDPFALDADQLLEPIVGPLDP